MGSAGPAEFGSGARFFPQTPEDSELEIALLVSFVRCFIRTLLVRLEPAALLRRGGERGDIIVLRSKIRTERTERAKDFFVCGDEIQRCGGPSILENRNNGQAKAPSTGGRR